MLPLKVLFENVTNSSTRDKKCFERSRNTISYLLFMPGQNAFGQDFMIKKKCFPQIILT
jgi:hypothetical protein